MPSAPGCRDVGASSDVFKDLGVKGNLCIQMSGYSGDDSDGSNSRLCLESACRNVAGVAKQQQKQEWRQQQRQEHSAVQKCFSEPLGKLKLVQAEAHAVCQY